MYKGGCTFIDNKLYDLGAMFRLYCINDMIDIYIVSCCRVYHHSAQPYLKKGELLLYSIDLDKSNHILLHAIWL